MNLTERQAEILRLVVDRYIATGEPVGSGEVAESLSAQVSPATVRAEMKQLEDNGWLHQPHTSSGRVPTDTGYRYFVNFLREQQRQVQLRQMEMLRREMVLRHAHRKLAQVARTLAQVTRNMTLLGDKSSWQVAGHQNLIQHPEFADIAEEAMTLLDDPDKYFQPIFRQLDSEPLVAVIGSEWNPHSGLALVAGRSKAGVVGVLGPKRMDYKKVIPAVEVIIEVLND